MKCNEVIAAVVFAGRQSQTDSTYKGRLSLREGEGRVRVAPSEIVLPGGLEPLTLILSPRPRGEAKQNGMNTN
jgi:hypothetical protein